MFEGIVVAMLVLGAAAWLARRALRRAGAPAPGKDGCATSCTECPAARKGDCCLPACILAGAMLAAPAAARAADTMECYPPAALDIEMSLGSSNMGFTPEEREVSATALIGFGLSGRVSVHASMSSSGDGRLAHATTAPSMGFLVTPFSAGHWSADVACEVTHDVTSRSLAIAPVMEFNFDAAPDQSAWGAYARPGLCLTARDETGRAVPSWNATVGGYRTVAPGNQLLLEIGFTREPGDEETRRWACDRWAVGYNTGIAPDVELVSGIEGAGFSRGARSAGVSFSLGIIASVPIGR